ncbi:TPA: hypothetical protein JLR27_004748 [Escherichia coli]|nr:hypothetical protein [Escherichia coli]
MAEWEKMKQMSLIEMNGFLKGKCIPGDLKVNETNAEYLVRKFAELESKLETALRECRSAGITIDNLEAKCDALAAENADLKSSREILAKNTLEACNAIASSGFRHEAIMRGFYASTGNVNKYPKPITTLVNEAMRDFQTPATDAFLAEVRAQGVEMFAECAYTLEHHDHAVAFAAELRKGGNQ